jgi:DNA-binding Xre family transcriptional regulator
VGRLCVVLQCLPGDVVEYRAGADDQP